MARPRSVQREFGNRKIWTSVRPLAAARWITTVARRIPSSSDTPDGFDRRSIRCFFSASAAVCWRMYSEALSASFWAICFINVLADGSSTGESLLSVAVFFSAIEWSSLENSGSHSPQAFSQASMRRLTRIKSPRNLQHRRAPHALPMNIHREEVMAKSPKGADRPRMKRKAYEKELRKLQVELCRLQDWVKQEGLRVIIVFEGRDAAGKGGTIKAITERVSPRVFRVVALPAPSDRQKSEMF